MILESFLACFIKIKYEIALLPLDLTTVNADEAYDIVTHEVGN